MYDVWNGGKESLQCQSDGRVDESAGGLRKTQNPGLRTVKSDNHCQCMGQVRTEVQEQAPVQVV